MSDDINVILTYLFYTYFVCLITVFRVSDETGSLEVSAVKDGEVKMKDFIAKVSPFSTYFQVHLILFDLTLVV